jgi:hypothetical protein
MNHYINSQFIWFQFYRLYIVTWNVATKYPEQNLNQLLGLNNFISTKQLPDIYVIG